MVIDNIDRKIKPNTSCRYSFFKIDHTCVFFLILVSCSLCYSPEEVGDCLHTLSGVAKVEVM